MGAQEQAGPICIRRRTFECEGRRRRRGREDLAKILAKIKTLAKHLGQDLGVATLISQFLEDIEASTGALGEVAIPGHPGEKMQLVSSLGLWGSHAYLVRKRAVPMMLEFFQKGSPADCAIINALKHHRSKFHGAHFRWNGQKLPYSFLKQTSGRKSVVSAIR